MWCETEPALLHGQKIDAALQADWASAHRKGLGRMWEGSADITAPTGQGDGPSLSTAILGHGCAGREVRVPWWVIMHGSCPGPSPHAHEEGGGVKPTSTCVSVLQ